MRDNLEGLTEMLNIELKDIKVSEELKLRTLERCKSNKKNSAEKGFFPIMCTIVACLFMGVIIYPIYNNNSLVGNEKLSMKTSDKEVKELDKSTMEPSMRKNESSNTDENSNEIIKSEILKEDQKKVYESSEELKQEKEVIVLNEDPTILFKIRSSSEMEERNKGILDDSKDIAVATNEDIIGKEKNTTNYNENSFIALSEEKKDSLETSEEVKMKILSLQEAREIFQDKIKIPSYVPRNFVMEEVLVPEIENSSCKVYEIIYTNESEYFKITEYKNANNISGLVSNSNAESNLSDENNMIININNTPVKYILREDAENKSLSYVKLTWEHRDKKYSAEGNAPWAELINIVSSIIN